MKKQVRVKLYFDILNNNIHLLFLNLSCFSEISFAYLEAKISRENYANSHIFNIFRNENDWWINWRINFTLYVSVVNLDSDGQNFSKWTSSLTCIAISKLWVRRRTDQQVLRNMSLQQLNFKFANWIFYFELTFSNTTCIYIYISLS